MRGMRPNVFIYLIIATYMMFSYNIFRGAYISTMLVISQY